MEFRQVRYFVAVAEELHFGRAADRCHVAQPALSRQIRALEEELGVRLLTRTSRSVALTPEGEWFLGEARGLLERADRTVETVGRMARGQAGRLRALFVPAASQTPFPDLLRAFSQACPGVRLELDEKNTIHQIEALARGEADVGLIRGHGLDQDRLPAGLEHRLFLAEPYVLAIPADHALARKKTVHLSMLDRIPFIGFPRAGHPGLHDAVARAFRAAGAEPDTVQETAFKQTALALVAAGLGVALVPASLARLKPSGVRFRPLEPACGQPGALPLVEFSLAWPKGRNTVALQRFLELAAEISPNKDMKRTVDGAEPLAYTTATGTQT